MNATLKKLHGIEQPQRTILSDQANQAASRAASQRDNAAGSYGRGVYAGHASYALDFSTQGSYGRGVYAGRSTQDRDYNTPGSYARGVYAGRSTAGLDFGPQGSFASGV